MTLSSVDTRRLNSLSTTTRCLDVLVTERDRKTHRVPLRYYTRGFLDFQPRESRRGGGNPVQERLSVTTREMTETRS